MLASLDLQLWQHMIARGLHEHSIAAEVIALEKIILMPMIQLCSSAPTIPFKLCKRQFTIKIAIFTTNNKAQGQTLKHCNISTITSFSSWPSLCDIFPILFI
jgi:hypothetical protein